MAHSWLLFSQWSCQQHTAEVLEWVLSLSLLRDIPQVHPTVFWIFIFYLVKLRINIFNMCLLVVWTMWTRILISSCLFPLCLVKFGDTYMFRRLTSFLCSPSSNHFLPVLGHFSCHCRYTLWSLMPPPCWFLLKTAFLSNSSLYEMDLPLFSCPLCQNTTLWKRKAEFFLAWLGLKRPEPPDPSLLL